MSGCRLAEASSALFSRRTPCSCCGVSLIFADKDAFALGAFRSCCAEARGVANVTAEISRRNAERIVFHRPGVEACSHLLRPPIVRSNVAVVFMFIDEATIRVKAGDGGNVIMESSEQHNTLVHFRFNPEYKAQRGRHGEGSNKTGRQGEDILLKVPVGTIVYDADSGEKVHDFSYTDERVVIARGGRGGRGNARFATSTHQAPREHEEGRPGEERTLRLELKLLADVGLVGYPNAGKSTLISV